MASTPVRPDEEQKIAPETERVLRERDAMFEKEYPKREDKEKAMKDLRNQLDRVGSR